MTNNQTHKPDMQALKKYQLRKRWAKVAWVYTILLSISTMMLGVFFVAFMASLKDNPLEQPFRFNFPQVQPSNWVSAHNLGKQTGSSGFMSSLKPGAKIDFFVTYATSEGKKFTVPKIEIPKLRAGTGMGAVLIKEHAADYITITDPVLIEQQENISFEGGIGKTKKLQQGHSGTWQFTLSYAGDAPELSKLPMNIIAPRGQVLIDSTIPPNRTERLGRVSAWDNIATGSLGYIFKNYVRVYTETVSVDTQERLFLTWTINSFFIAIGKVILTLFFACTAGYALARIKFTGSRIIFTLMLVSMIIPGQVTFISNYLVFKTVGLLQTPWAVIMMVVASAQVLIMKQFFENLPKELEEAAIIDGANHFTILFRIFMPLAKPALITVTILGFQGAWNDFFWPLIVLNGDAEALTLPVGLLSLRNAYGVAGDWNLILAGSFLSTIPVLIIFIIFQRYFVDNDINSATKG